MFLIKKLYKLKLYKYKCGFISIPNVQGAIFNQSYYVPNWFYSSNISNKTITHMAIEDVLV